jgi:hypothetical protein
LQELCAPYADEMRTDAMGYVSGIPGATAARRELSACTTAAEFCAVFDQMEAHLGRGC